MRPILVAGTLAAALASATPAAAGDQFWKDYADVMAIGIPLSAGVITLAREDHNGFIQLAETGGVTILATQALKYSVDSTRPNGGNYSFPSGHTAVAFAGAGYLHARYGWRTGLPFEILAATVGFARVQSKDHHWYDVVAGAAIGEGSAFLLTKRLNENVRVSLAGDTRSGLVTIGARF